MNLDPKTWWYVARASGVVALVLASTSVAWGTALSSRLTRRPRPAWVLDLHRFLGGLTVTFVAVHIAGLVADNYTHWGWSDVLVPMSTAWHPLAVAPGVVALYLLVAVEATSLLMQRLPRKVWHAVHLSSYALWVGAVLHGITAGTDRHTTWFRLTAALPVAVVIFTTTFRVLTRNERRTPRASSTTATRAEAA